MTGHGPAVAAVGNAAGTTSSGTYFSAYSVVGILLLLGVAFVATAFGANRLLSPHAPSPEKLLTYALGRGIEYYDGPAVREIVRLAKAKDFRFSAVIDAIVASPPFQMRTSR